MTTKEKLFEKKTIIKEIATKHGAYDIRVFGSVSRGDNREDSDIDLLVKTTEHSSSWFPGGLSCRPGRCFRTESRGCNRNRS